MIQKHPPGIQTDTEAIDARLLEGVLVEEAEKLEDGKERIELHSFQVRGNKPVKEIATLC